MNSMRHQNYKIENASTKNAWYDCLMKHISALLKRSVGSIKEKVMNLFKKT